MTKKLRTGEVAPPFELLDQHGKTWLLRDLVAAGKRTVLYFYPADDTPGCTAESCDFRDHSEEFASAGVQILGVSPQGAESHRRFAEKYDLNFPLLIDEDLKVAESYGAVAEKPGEFNGIPLKIKRSTFVIGPDGRIEQTIYGVRVKGHVDALRESLSL